MTDLVTYGLITLYQLDTAALGSGDLLRFTSASDFDTSIYWGGWPYFPVPMDAQGFEMNTKGQPPTPSVVFSNLHGAGTLLLDSYNGLIGADLIRIVTLRRFLDDGATPDPNAFISRDKFVIAQKTSHNATQITFKLAIRVDQEGIQLPRRQILRDVCSHTYRVFDQNATGVWFDYSKASCPWTGLASNLFFDANDNQTDITHDQCSRTLQGCRLRFGYSYPLPARFFPGVGKVK